MVSAAQRTGRRFSLARSRAGALLCVALMVVTAWAVLAGGWVVGGGGAVVVAVTAVLEAALLARAAVPRLVAVLVVPLYAVLATNVLTAKSSELIGLPETVAVFLSLLVIAQVHLDSLQATWRLRSVSPLSGTRSRFAASVTVTAIGLTLVALVLPP